MTDSFYEDIRWHRVEIDDEFIQNAPESEGEYLVQTASGYVSSYFYVEDDYSHFADLDWKDVVAWAEMPKGNEKWLKKHC